MLSDYSVPHNLHSNDNVVCLRLHHDNDEVGDASLCLRCSQSVQRKRSTLSVHLRRSEGHHVDGCRGSANFKRRWATCWSGRLRNPNLPFAQSIRPIERNVQPKWRHRTPTFIRMCTNPLCHAECASLPGSMPRAPRKMIAPTIMGPGKTTSTSPGTLGAVSGSPGRGH